MKIVSVWRRGSVQACNRRPVRDESLHRALLSTLVTAVLTVSWAMIAQANDVPVSYTVNEKALKAGAPSGTMLTFELHTDSACSGAVYTQAVAIDDIGFIERLKLLTPKGGTKPARTDKLVHVLTGAPAESIYFLKVTGAGITPMGGDCQLQFSAAAASGTSLPCASQVGNDVIFEGCNVHIRNGGGSTASANSLGNLIVGYNEGAGFARSGSHNLVVGTNHEWRRWGGVVTGDSNDLEAPYASITGGSGNVAEGTSSSVSGGLYNHTTASYASISGGVGNLAGPGSIPLIGATNSGEAPSVSGGRSNQAVGSGSSISGGLLNEATASYGAIAGGVGNLVGTGSVPAIGAINPGEAPSVGGGRSNQASATGSSVAGGHLNTASGDFASVTGGAGNLASDESASVSGGENNHARARLSSVNGGTSNGAFGAWSSVSGGYSNIAAGAQSAVSGGDSNTAETTQSVVSGGQDNHVRVFNSMDTTAATIGGGRGVISFDPYEWVAGGGSCSWATNFGRCDP